jgi:hypothetical protein
MSSKPAWTTSKFEDSMGCIMRPYLKKVIASLKMMISSSIPFPADDKISSLVMVE